MASSSATANAMTGPAASTLVPHLAQYVVSPGDLTCAEYCFRTSVNFNQKLQDDEGVTHLKQILTALLNTSGGIIEIQNKDSLQPTADTLDKWKCNLEDVLSTFIPKDILAGCVHLSATYPLILHVAKSNKLITMRNGLFDRGFASTKQVNDIDSIQDILSRRSQQRIPFPLPVNQELRYGDTVTTPEGPNVEYKYWKAAKDLKDLKQRLEHERTSKTLFALPNMPQGGYIVIGVEEDTPSGSNKIRGQIISEIEEGELTEFLETHFQQDRSGQPRLWGDGSREPVRGRDWKIKFIEVQNGPTPERRRVILIDFQHFPGGVFDQFPETYYVAENGEVHSLSPESWRRAVMASHMTITTQDSRNLYGTRSKVPVSTTNTQGSSSSESKDPTTKKSTAESSGEKQREGHDKEDVVKSRGYLSWTRHGSNWNEPMEQTSLDLMKNADKLANESKIFEMLSPINFAPCRKTLLDVTGSNSEDMENAIKHVEATHARCKAFGIATATWPLLLKSEHTIEKPQGHIFDIFAVNGTGEILLWAIVDDKTCQINTVWKYLYLSGRLTKRNMLCNQQHKTRSINSIQVKARVYILGRGEATPLTNPLPVPHDKVLEMKICLATAVLEKNTRIKSIFGDENSFILTAQQVQTILESGFKTFNYIEGPPGSGKTYMAIYLCQQYGNYAYICTTDAFRSFLIFQGLQPNCVFVVKDDAELIQLINRNCFSTVRQLIFDDFQQTQFQDSTWKKLFEYIRLTENLRLVVFGDSKYHNYQHSRNMLSRYMWNYCDENGFDLNPRTLSEVHRNTRKVTTFIKSTFAKTSNFPDHSRISCSNTENGDDVEVRRFSHMWADTEDNSFIDFLRQLIDPTKVLKNQPGSYVAKDVVILLDTQDINNYVKRLGAIIAKRLENTDIHDAATFPVTGLTIDSLDNFVGMDRRVCILVSSREILLSGSSSGHSINNPRYRAFVASRGIFRVVFAVEEPLTTSLTEALNFGELNLVSSKNLQPGDDSSTTIGQDKRILEDSTTWKEGLIPQKKECDPTSSLVKEFVTASSNVDLVKQILAERLHHVEGKAGGSLDAPGTVQHTQDSFSDDLNSASQEKVSRVHNHVNIIGAPSWGTHTSSKIEVPKFVSSKNLQPEDDLSTTIEQGKRILKDLTTWKEGLIPQKKGVKELWRLEKGELITDLCFIAVDGTLAILYISPLDPRICVVSTDGEPLSVSVDSPGVRHPVHTASSRDGRRVVIAGWDSDSGPPRCGVYEVRPGRLARVNMFTMNTEVWSVSWMRDDDVIVLLGTDHPRDVVRVSPTDGRVLWRLDSSVTHLRAGVRLSVNPRTDAILVCDTDCVRELSDQGQHIRDISLSSGVGPLALCVDSSGRLMFLGDLRGDIHLHNTSLGHTTTVIKAPGPVYNTRLHGDRYLGVATGGGIVMYDVSALF